jgi:hypothetical protein
VLWLLVGGIVGGVLTFVGLMVVGLQVPAYQGGDQALKVPSLKGRTLEAARQRVGENFKIISSGEASRQPESVIVSQDPNAGTEVRRGKQISVVVSTGPETARGPKPAPGYDLVEDPTGSLTVEVPSSWEVKMGEAHEKRHWPNSWSSYAGEYLASSITTAPSIDAWYGREPVSGAYIVASEALAQRYTDHELIYSKLYEGQAQICMEGLSKAFHRSSLAGMKQVWHNCAGRGFTNFIVAAAPEGRECVVVLQARLANEADREAIEHFIDTFEVECGRSD